MHEVEREQHAGRPGRFEARARPQTAMPALHTVTTAPGHMPVLPWQVTIQTCPICMPLPSLPCTNNS